MNGNDQDTNRKEVEFAEHGVHLTGELAVPFEPQGVVLFASPRPASRGVARALNRSGFATLIFDGPVLATQLRAATEWAARRPELRDLAIGYFGVGAGATAALEAAAEPVSRVQALVVRDARPGFAASNLARVKAPVRLIVGGDDRDVRAWNETALAFLENGELVSDASGEAGCLYNTAAQWFSRFLRRRPLRMVA